MFTGKLLTTAERMLDLFLIENRSIVFGTEFNVISRDYPEWRNVYFPFYIDSEKESFQSLFPKLTIFKMTVCLKIFYTSDQTKCILCVDNNTESGYDCFECTSHDNIPKFLNKLKPDISTDLKVKSSKDGIMKVYIMGYDSLVMDFNINEPLTISE